jgi:uncharacterized LabA/DUF88 family protein
MAKSRLERAVVLVDWNNTVSLLGRDGSRITLRAVIFDTISKIQSCTAKILSSLDGITKYACAMRIYDGWHSLKEPTDLRKKFDELIPTSQFKNALSRTIGRVSFLPEINYGDHLLYDERYGTLYNTKRAQEQKMVDTAIVCDTLAILLTRYARMVVIVSDDDDFIPPMVSAEALGHKVILVRGAGRTLEEVCNIGRSDGVKFWE